MFHVFNWEDIDKEFLWNLHTIYMKNSSHARGSIGDTQSAWTATCNKSIQQFPGQRAEVKHVKANLGHCTQQHFSLSNCFRNILQMFVKDKQILGKSEPSIFCRYLLMTVTGWVICTSTPLMHTSFNTDDKLKLRIKILLHTFKCTENPVSMSKIMVKTLDLH